VFDDVHFAYREDEAVLRGISFVAEPGKLTALVGPSGSGKTTIINLILRFYDIERGKIAIDGQDIRQVSRRSLRRHLAYVGQDVFLFRGTIRDNIAFGKPDASEAEIVAAAKGAYAHDFITSFPRGYDTPVGEHGLQLSGGQRQRVAVARALANEPPLILADEPTGSLDSKASEQVFEVLRELVEKHGKTVVAVTHDLALAARMDRHVELLDGRVVADEQHHLAVADPR
jgi:ATP-binding cassette subfamily B protein